MCKLLEKESKLKFYEVCLKDFEHLKEFLISAPIIVAPDRTSPFKVMCNASGITVGAVLGQCKEKTFSSYLLC